MKNFIHISFVFCLMLGALSCQNSLQTNSSDSAEKHSDSVQIKQDSVPQSVAEKADNSFPKNVEILLPTQYRKESTGYPKNIKNKEWFELYKNTKTGKWLIGKANLQISYGYDECAGEDIMIVQSNHEDAVLFFTGFEGLNENPQTILTDKMLFPEHNVSFNFNGKDYRLSPMGSCLDENGEIMTVADIRAKTDEQLENNTKISGYQLLFNSAEKTQGLALVKSIEYATPKVVWAGDLNSDGLPDMILDLSEYYECQHYYFFLSDKNDSENSLKKIADLQVINDC